MKKAIYMSWGPMEKVKMLGLDVIYPDNQTQFFALYDAEDLSFVVSFLMKDNPDCVIKVMKNMLEADVMVKKVIRECIMK